MEYQLRRNTYVALGRCGLLGFNETHRLAPYCVVIGFSVAQPNRYHLVTVPVHAETSHVSSAGAQALSLGVIPWSARNTLCSVPILLQAGGVAGPMLRAYAQKIVHQSVTL
jgi:hypothetical protein